MLVGVHNWIWWWLIEFSGSPIGDLPINIDQPVRLSFQPLIVSQPTVFFSHINQPTVLSAVYFQSEQA
jgi:hypothetical protein